MRRYDDTGVTMVETVIQDLGGRLKRKEGKEDQPDNRMIVV